MLFLVCRETEGPAQRTARRPTTIMDERRTNGSFTTRLEQENDHEPSVEDIRDPVQLTVDVRAG